MSDATYDYNDPKQLAELLEKVEGLKSVFSNAMRLENERGKRNKYEAACKELNASDLPFIHLSTETFKNKSIASMRSQFKRVAEETKLSFVPSVVEYDGQLLLINFDAEQAEEKFNNYILKLSGIDASELQKIAADLDRNTR